MNISVCHVTLSAGPGGGPEHIRQLVSHLAPLGVRQYVAAPREEPYAEIFQGLVGPENMFEMPGRTLRPRCLLGLAAFLRQRGCQVVHSHGKGAGLYARPAGLLAGVARVHTFHGLHRQYSPLGNACYDVLERFLGRVTGACVAVSPSEAEEARQRGYCPGARLHTVVNGVPVERELPATHGQSRDVFRIVHCSRYERQKNSGALVDVALALRDRSALAGVEFAVLGVGKGRADLQRRITAAGLDEHFRFPGFVDPRPYFDAASCYLSTSLWEGMPLAVLEAAARGLPPVCSNVVGNCDAVEDGVTGLLYPVDRPAAAAEALGRLQADEQLRLRLGRAAHARVLDRFSVVGMASNTLAVYRKVLERSG